METPNDNVGIRLRKLTRSRMILAIAVGVIADGLQLLLGPLGWVFADAAIDVVAMILVSWLIGFHWLFLPTVVLEAVPVIDAFPTWTACVIAVIAIRRRPPAISNPGGPPVER